MMGMHTIYHSLLSRALALPRTPSLSTTTIYASINIRGSLSLPSYVLLNAKLGSNTTNLDFSKGLA